MAYNHWFVSRQKRQLTSILSALIAYSDVCEGKVWAGNTELQLMFEDELQRRNITNHGTLRARRSKQGGGGIRTLFKQLKDLGLVFTEEENGVCRLTLIGEALIKGNMSFVDAMRLQLQRYQYPSAAVWAGSGSIDHSFKVHPFQFMFRLLRDSRLNNRLSMDEMYGIVIHKAMSDNEDCFEKVLGDILTYRQKGFVDGFIADTETKTYSNIANTFFNYISLTQYIDRGDKSIMIRAGKESLVDEFVESNPRFIPNPEIQENYLRAYGKGRVAKDLRDFSKNEALSKKELDHVRIRKEYVLLALKTPITGITTDVIDYVVGNTGIDEKEVESFLIQNYPHGNIDDFFVSYKELAHMGTSGATDFELATCELFKKVFGMNAKHVGSIGNTPDVFVESSIGDYCGIIDNKAYKNGYSITGDHKRVMEDVYIPKYKEYGNTKRRLAFYMYIAGSFGKNINNQINEIYSHTNIKGSAMPVDLLIDLAQDYIASGFDHRILEEIFSVNREVRISDIKNTTGYWVQEELPLVAEDFAKYSV